jgi:hypothetical protein
MLPLSEETIFTEEIGPMSGHEHERTCMPTHI